MSDPIYQDATMAQVRAVDGTYISYPFIEDGDTQTKVYNMVCTQLATDYNAAQVALDTPMSSAAAAGVIALPFPADSAAYFVGDTGHTPVGGGMISFTRTFANIPQTVTVASGSQFVTFPGIFGTASFGTRLNITGVTNTFGVKGVTITTEFAHGLSVGDTVFLSMSYKINSEPFIHNVMGQFFVYDIYGDQSFRIDIGRVWQLNQTINIQPNYILARNPIGRDPISYNVNTSTRYDYILPGVSSGIATAQDVAVPPTFQAVRAGGTPTDTLNDTIVGITTLLGTSPSATEYLYYVEKQHNLIIESSLSEWAGNILVMKTKTCKAR